MVILNLNEYITFIEEYSDKMLFRCNRYNINDPLGDNPLLMNDSIRYVNVKRSIITEHEKNRANIIHIPSITELNIDDETKLLLTSIYLDILNEIGKKELILCFDKYNKGQPIFEGNDLFEYVRRCGELIDYDAFIWLKESNFCKYDNKFFEATSILRGELIEFINRMCQNYKKYIRIHPYYCYSKLPPMIFYEEALRPVNPNWIKTLNLFKGQSTGGHYILQPSETGEFEIDRLRFWDYEVQKVRSLEIHAQRSNSGNLSMMIEEIKDNQKYSSYYIAKCIHLETNNEVGTNIDDTTLNNIDLAINVYDNSAYEQRIIQSLSNGRVVDATYRTHLLRLENVPFRILINLSYLFFDSQVLTAEWISEQFSS